MFTKKQLTILLLKGAICSDCIKSMNSEYLIDNSFCIHKHPMTVDSFGLIRFAFADGNYCIDELVRDKKLDYRHTDHSEINRIFEKYFPELKHL